MKKLFTVIRQGKLDEVIRILDKDPDLISCLAVAPPKKDHGQSPLMVAIKSDNPAVAHLLLAHGVDIHDYELNEEHRATTSLLIRNLEEGRELFDGFHGLDPEKLKPITVKYRGKEHIIQPTPVEEQRQRYEIKWRELEPALRSFYE